MNPHTPFAETAGRAARKRELHGCVRVAGLAYEFPGRVLWADLSMNVQPGRMLALCGQSGSGKTTLLQCIGGLEKPTTGEIDVAGHKVRELRGPAQRDFWRRRVGFAFQASGVVASWTVRKNLELSGVEIRRKGNRELTNDARLACQTFAFNPDFIDTLAYRLSGGEQQRVSLMRVALQRPDVLLLDEPSSALDDANTDRLLAFVKEHTAQGGSAIIATHDARLTSEADDVLTLS